MDKRKKVAVYTRISTIHQKTDSQDNEIEEFIKRHDFEIYKKYHDTFSGAKDSRPALKELMFDASKKKFDIVLVYKFDRFARSLKFLVDSLEVFRLLNIDFISIKEAIDTSTPMGKLIFSINSAYAEFEREIIRQRVIDGLNARKAKGYKLGGPEISKYKQEQIKELINQKIPTRKIATMLGISRGSVMKYKKIENSKTPNKKNF